MKRFSIISVMLVIVLAFGLVLMSCGDGDGGGGYSGGGYSGGVTSPPNIPTGVRATRNPAGSSTVRVSWSSVMGADYYRVYYSSTGTGSGWIEGSPSTTSFDSTGNSTDETHYFSVSAVNSAGEGLQSPWVSVGPVSSGGGTGTGTGSGSGTATVMIFNESSYYSLYATLNRGLDVIKSGTAYSNSTLTWTGVPTGVSLWISSADSYGDIFETGTFTLTSGQTKTFTYDGYSLR